MEKPEEHIEKLIVKSLKTTINKDEQTELKHWRENKENNKEFLQLENTWNEMEYLSNSFSSKEGWDDFNKRLKAKNKKRKEKSIRMISLIGSIAAMLVVAMGINYYHLYKAEGDISKTSFGIRNSDGEWIDLSDKEQHLKEVNFANQIVEINLNTIEMQNSSKGLNEIRVPKGKRLKLLLSDSSEIWLASMSTLLFPETFEGEKREVELIGEGFFKVRKNSAKPFIVKSKQRMIKVLGTEFNIDNTNPLFEQTTLVEGSVAMLDKEGNEETKLKPSEQFTLDNQTKKWEKKTVDTTPYTSWINGSLVFDDILFTDLEVKLERWYGVEIINSVEELNTETFTGEFNSSDNIISVMRLFEISNKVEYKIENDTIRIF